MLPLKTRQRANKNFNVISVFQKNKCKPNLKTEDGNKYRDKGRK